MSSLQVALGCSQISVCAPTLMKNALQFTFLANCIIQQYVSWLILTYWYIFLYLYLPSETGSCTHRDFESKTLLLTVYVKILNFCTPGHEKTSALIPTHEVPLTQQVCYFQCTFKEQKWRVSLKTVLYYTLQCKLHTSDPRNRILLKIQTCSKMLMKLNFNMNV